jgi:DNA-binding CsgD family transcriptional regulator
VNADERSLRPLERRIQRLVESGMSEADIAWRFRRSPGWIRRVRKLSSVPRPPRPRTGDGGLRPLERRVLRWLDGGASYGEIAARFRRSPEALRRLEVLARQRRSGSA